jgi:hypothetical protein
MEHYGWDVRVRQIEPARSELRKAARESVPFKKSGTQEADKTVFENKRIFIDFRDIQSEAQIKEIVYTAQQPHRNVKILIHHWDPNAEFGKFFEALQSEKLIVKSGSAVELARRYLRDFKGDIVVLAGSQTLQDAEFLKRQLEEISGAKQPFMLSYNQEESGVLGVGLRDLENGTLRRENNGVRLVKPAYMELQNGILRVTNAAEAGLGFWQQAYDRALAFARAA